MQDVSQPPVPAPIPPVFDPGVTPPVPCLVGPTGSGKTDVGIALARALASDHGLPAEVISCDAFAVYREISVLTAKPAPPPDVPHHLLDVCDPSETYSAARFAADADRLVAEIRARGRVPLVVGGTALYLKTWTKGFGPKVPRDRALRARLEGIAQAEGPAALHARLAALDPQRAGELHPNDVRRVVRALEIVETTGRKASDLRREWAAPDRFPVAVVGLSREAEDLDRRIEARVRAMPSQGLFEEVKRLLARDPPPSREMAQAIGLADVEACLEGEITVEECLERVVRRTRRFARKQMTFFRQLNVDWVPVPADEDPATTAARLRAALARQGPVYPGAAPAS